MAMIPHRAIDVWLLVDMAYIIFNNIRDIIVYKQALSNTFQILANVDSKLYFRV